MVSPSLIESLMFFPFRIILLYIRFIHHNIDSKAYYINCVVQQAAVFPWLVLCLRFVKILRYLQKAQVNMARRATIPTPKM